MRYQRWPKRDPIKNYFPLPNEIFHLRLKPGELAVYAFLLYCENRKTYQCYPSYHTITEHIDMSENTVSKYVKLLEEKGLITVEPTTITTKDGCVRNGSLLYTIRPIQEALEQFYEQQMKQLEDDAEKARLLKKAERYRKKHDLKPLEPVSEGTKGEAG